jgi:hypothetical protein
MFQGILIGFGFGLAGGVVGTIYAMKVHVATQVASVKAAIAAELKKLRADLGLTSS